MTTVLGFKRYLRSAVVAGEGAYLFSERGVIALRGRHVEELVPLLDGSRSRAEVLAEAPAGAPAEHLSALMTRLAAADLLAEYPAETPETAIPDTGAMAYWESAGLDGARAAGRLAATRVGLTILGAVDAAQAHEACRLAGLEVSADAELTVVLCDDYLDPVLSDIDARHRAEGRSWLLAKPSGTNIWIGPVFEPRESACWNCLSHRLWGNRWAEAQVQRARGQSYPASRPAVGIAASVALGLQFTMVQAAHWAAGYRTHGQRDILVLDMLTMEGRHHRIEARPQCVECGDPGLTADRAWQPVRLVSRRKASCDGGGHRACTPQEVYDRYGHLISPITGLVAEIVRDPDATGMLHAYVAGENPVLRPTRPGAMDPSLRNMNGGKGVTALDARVGALCEALERRSGSFHGDETRVTAAYDHVRDYAVHPNDCQLYDERQFRERLEWNRTRSAMQYVCAPFDESVPIDWTPVWSLTHQRHRLLPTGMLYYGAPHEAGLGFVRADSNGAAAGSCLEDAILQGLLELIERDAVALWWYNRTRHPEVDLGSFGDPWIDRLKTAYAGFGRELWAIDITSDFGIPVVVALSRRTGGPAGDTPEDIVFGFGAHLDPHVAVRRALTEMNQILPAALRLRQAGAAGGDPDARRWWDEATVASEPYLLPCSGRPVGLADHPWTFRSDLLEDVEALTALAAAKGLEVLVLDQTRCDIGLPVVKVVVPGLRHFWARFAPGRLYDVPVELGRVTNPTVYDELNPVPLFV
ncbi:TOMM precursor leader peptide-binding protein [Streptosporangiaceae bacterium NEAU-GS5]|nr:TOMM precursor leader peptide-binding protein [Streptosporangiaceae bacterium NEAU-GS5]